MACASDTAYDRSWRGERRIRERRRGVARRHADVPWSAAPRVLLIASAIEVRLLYAALLEEAGYSVYAVADAIEALRTITVRMPDAVVLGHGSSGPDSLALLNALRGDVSTSDVPAVILTSANVQSGASGRDRHSGPTMLLGEPVSGDAVLAAVDDLTRATPPERFARRQLRRSLLALRKVVQAPAAEAPEHVQPPEADRRHHLCAVIDRLHVPVLGMDDHGAYVAVSRGAEALVGYTRAELTATTVFDAAMGSHLPLASLWEAHTSDSRSNGTATLRDKTGRTIKVAFAIERVLPDLHALALVHTSE
jgi:PAS domain S-box-containing protein